MSETMEAKVRHTKIKNAKSNVLRDELQARAQAEREALEIISKLASIHAFEESQVEMMLHRLMISHFNEVIEERSITGICGYPCCKSKLTKISSKQKYHISLQNKKVYDMEELQMFCSLFCYKASNYIKSQLPTEPIWVRPPIPTKLKFLQRDIKIDPSKLASDKEIVFEKIEDLSVDDETETEINNERPSPPPSENTATHLHSPKKEFQTEKTSTEPCLSRIKDVIEEWMAGNSKQTDTTVDKSDHQPQRLTQSDYHARAMQFFNQSPEWLFEGRPKEDTSAIGDEDDLSQEEVRAVPVVGNCSQTTIRRRIVKDKLQKSLSRVLENYGLSIAEIWKNVNAELTSFEFSKDNINLKPSEWTIVSLMLLKRLAQNDSTISDIFTRNLRKTIIIIEKLNVKLDDFNDLFDKSMIKRDFQSNTI